MITAKIILDSISPLGVRLVTMELVYPRYCHAELMTHRVFSRNAASTRAIPTKKIADMVLENLVYPIKWGLNQPGMQSKDEELSPEQIEKAKAVWENMAKVCVDGCKELTDLGLHKQWAGRPLEAFMHMTTLVSSTEWDNFFELRDHPDAFPDLHELAKQMKKVMNESIPTQMNWHDWHLPFIKEDEQNLDIDTKLKISTARCARVSYLTHDGQNPSVENDVKLYDRLVGSVPLHASPAEHQAKPMGISGPDFCGNFRGWKQHRKFIEEKMK